MYTHKHYIFEGTRANRHFAIGGGARGMVEDFFAPHPLKHFVAGGGRKMSILLNHEKLTLPKGYFRGKFYV